MAGEIKKIKKGRRYNNFNSSPEIMTQEQKEQALEIIKEQIAKGFTSGIEDNFSWNLEINEK